MLSANLKYRLAHAVTDQELADELIAAIESGANPQAAAVAALAASNLSAIAGTYAIPAEPTGAEVDATVQSLATELESRLDADESKINAVIAALKAAGLMAS